jgi:hypothetical protein
MRSALAILACAAVLVVADNSMAQAAAVGEAPIEGPGIRGKTTELVIRARVVEVDQARRSLVLRGPKGKLVDLDVPAEVKNFEQIRAGDELTLHYSAAIAALIEPLANRTGVRERVESQRAGGAASSALPAAGGERTVQVLAVVEAIDRKGGTVTLRGVKRTVRLVVPAGVDIGKLKVGDEVRAVFIESAVLSIDHSAAR